MKYILTQIEDDGASLSHTFTTDTLEEMLNRYLYFLRGCSFVISSRATLGIVKPLLPESPFADAEVKTSVRKRRSK